MYRADLTYRDATNPAEISHADFQHEDRHQVVRFALDHIKAFGVEHAPFRIDTHYASGWADPTVVEPKAVVDAQDQA